MTPPHRDRPWRRYVALGDSFTEGLSDAPRAPETTGPDASSDPADPVYVGWADRLALLLDEDQRRTALEQGQEEPPPLEYANLAVRGRLARQVVDAQVPAALGASPDLVSLTLGGNDTLRPGADVPAIARLVDGAVGRLRASGSDVLLVTGFDPSVAPVLRLTRGKVADYNQRLWATATRHGAHVLDLWSFPPLLDTRMWAEDRLHLSTAGHERVAALALATLRGQVPVPGQEASWPAWATPLEPEPVPRAVALAGNAAWARVHLAPWVGRRLRGRSTGDGRTAKRPVPTPVDRTRTAI